MYVAVVGHKIVPIANTLNRIQKSSSTQLFVFNFSSKLPIGMPFFPEQYLARKSVISLSVYALRGHPFSATRESWNLVDDM